MVVISPARLPNARMSKEAKRDAPQDPRLQMDKDTHSAKNVRPQANGKIIISVRWWLNETYIPIGWRTRAAVRVREISFSYPLMCLR